MTAAGGPSPPRSTACTAGGPSSPPPPSWWAWGHWGLRPVPGALHRGPGSSEQAGSSRHSLSHLWWCPLWSRPCPRTQAGGLWPAASWAPRSAPAAAASSCGPGPAGTGVGVTLSTLEPASVYQLTSVLWLASLTVKMKVCTVCTVIFYKQNSALLVYWYKSK